MKTLIRSLCLIIEGLDFHTHVFKFYTERRKKRMNHQLDARTGIREALPTVFGYIGIGIAFGIVGQAAGFSPLIVSAMSFLFLQDLLSL